MSAVSQSVLVTCAPAQEMLEELARLGRVPRPHWRTERFTLPPPDSCDAVTVEALQFTPDDAAEMRERLEESGLDLLLPGGLDSLPDITASAPWPLRSLLRIGLPRSYRQLARHVARNLEWYLDPENTPLTFHRYAPLLSLLSIGASGWFFWSALKWLASGIGWFPSYAGVMVVALAMAIPTWALIVFGIMLPLSQLKPSQQDRFNARQLYYYLLDSYADWDEPEVASHSNALSQGNVKLTEASNS